MSDRISSEFFDDNERAYQGPVAVRGGATDAVTRVRPQDSPGERNGDGFDRSGNAVRRGVDPTRAPFHFWWRSEREPRLAARSCRVTTGDRLVDADHGGAADCLCEGLAGLLPLSTFVITASAAPRRLVASERAVRFHSAHAQYRNRAATESPSGISSGRTA